MPKQCAAEKCLLNVFAKKYCKYHQYLRDDYKKPTIKKTPIRKFSKKRRSLLGERRLQTEKDWLFYLEIWEERKHFCYETNEFLGNTPQTLFFHHVLPKAARAYKRFRYSRWNIVLISWQTHSKAETNIKFVPRIQAYRDYLLANLDDIKKGTLIPEPENISV